MRYRIDFGALPWETPIPGLRCKRIKQGGRQLRLVEYSREMQAHWCLRGHLGYILEGRFEITFDDRVEMYGPGDGVFIPPGEEHRHMAHVVGDPVLAIFVEDD